VHLHIRDRDQDGHRAEIARGRRLTQRGQNDRSQANRATVAAKVA
jgi:hypothetical protein